MKKFLLVLVVLLFATPALAAVNITATQVGDTNEVIISWDASTETNLVRAFALNIQLSNDANIISATGMSADYYIYPGTIAIDAGGNVTSFGSIAAPFADLPSDTLPGPPDGNGVTLEAASLYAPTGPGSPNAPAASGDLASIIVSGDTCITITANVSRAGATGVVMEDPAEVVTVNYSAELCIIVDVPPVECMMVTHPAYADWVTWGKPDCWCYTKQCNGDINGTSFLGKPVTLADLTAFKAAFAKSDAELPADGICADNNHAGFLGKRVTLTDLTTFKAYFTQSEASVPECDQTHINFPTN